MGLSLSILISAWKEIIDQGLKILCKNHSFCSRETAMILKSNSFKIREQQEPIKNRAKPNSLKGNKPERVILERNPSFKSLVEDVEFSFSAAAAGVRTPVVSLPEPAVMYSPRPASELDAAAVKVKKVYKSYRTRRNLADCAVVVEENVVEGD